MTFESRHDAERWGPLTAPNDEPLVSLADLVRALAGLEVSVPMSRAKLIVIDRMARSVDAPLFMTQPDDYAREINAADVFGSTGGAGGAQTLRGIGGALFAQARIWRVIREGTQLDDKSLTVNGGQLAILRADAEGLFDEVFPRSFWEGGPDVRGPSGPDGEFTCGLECLPEHDAIRWGAPRTDGKPSRRVVRVADLVRLVGGRSSDTTSEAASVVLDTLMDCWPLPAYLMTPGNLSRPVGDSDIWRQRYRSGVDFLRDRDAWQRQEQSGGGSLRESCRIHFPMGAHGISWEGNGYMPPDEALLRGIPFITDSDHLEAQTGPRLTDDEWRLVPPLPALFGASGLLDWLRFSWVRPGMMWDGLDEDPHAAVAILVSDAVRLFGLRVTMVASTAQQLVQATDIGVQSRASPPGLVVTLAGAAWKRTPGARWTDVERDAVFKMRHVDQMTDEAIGKVIGVSHQRVSQLIGSREQWRCREDDWPASISWRPSAVLLRECDLAAVLQPLQSVAGELIQG